MINTTELERRKALTFEQAEGYEELPRQLLRDEMSDVLRARLLHALVVPLEAEMSGVGLQHTIGPVWSRILRQIRVEYFGLVSASFDNGKANNVGRLEQVFRDAEPREIYGFLQALVRIAKLPALSKAIEKTLEVERSAYRLVDSDTLVPFGSEQEGETVARAVNDLKQQGHLGAQTHLKEAAANLSAGAFADSVRESVHAVESVLRSLTGSGKLSDALSELSKRRPFHSAFSNGIKQLYGFASDEPGVRHPLLEKGDAAVTEEDAMFMLGTCASLVTYFTRSFSKA